MGVALINLKYLVERVGLMNSSLDVRTFNNDYVCTLYSVYESQNPLTD